MLSLNKATDAILCIDLQNDFLPGGSLAAPQGDNIVEPVIDFISKAKALGMTIVCTRYLLLYVSNYKRLASQQSFLIPKIWWALASALCARINWC